MKNNLVQFYGCMYIVAMYNRKSVLQINNSIIYRIIFVKHFFGTLENLTVKVLRFACPNL